VAEDKMTVTEEINTSERRPAGAGPGERLQAARIQQGLSLEDVASRMHLSINILEAIEENDFEEITAPIFVKGYLRAYARIVALDEDEMITLYSDFYSEEDPPITSTSNMVPELTVTDARIKWTTYLVIIVLGALLAAWWWNKEQNQEAPISLDAQAPVGEGPEAAQDDVASSEIAAVSESAIESSSEAEPMPVTEPEIEAETPVVEPTEAEAEADPVAEAEPEPAETIEVESAPEAAVTGDSDADSDETVAASEAEPSSETELESEPETLAQVESPAQLQVVQGGEGLRLTRLAPSGSDKLVIVVHADTWADIKDGADNQMVYDLLRANQTMEVTGEAPFVVFLGNGHGVEITFNGESVEVLSRVRNDNTVRLKVGG
jgi:cytoskeleton protein RodZ